MVSWSQTPSDTSWPRTLGQMLNYTYPQGGATLNLGLHTFLVRGQVYLVNKVHVGTHSLDALRFLYLFTKALYSQVQAQ
ncbi:hypothetical protein DPMN_002200 [Dreissena polymorpha]|uniref:Uncharacterized protein n=1 Tax=Dreissena polymorpha TaxID=45954 RepID=A0A9D4RTR6_DREPO|nr:hypothetical protein DPMN_002200 [Dreissena polymorpha]